MKLKINEKVKLDYIDDSVMVFKEKEGIIDLENVIVLEETAYDIIKIIETNKNISFSNLLYKLHNIYDCEKKELESDLNEFLLDLKKQEVISIDE